MDSSDAHQNQMMQVLSDPNRASAFARVVFELLKAGCWLFFGPNQFGHNQFWHDQFGHDGEHSICGYLNNTEFNVGTIWAQGLFTGLEPNAAKGHQKRERNGAP